MKSIVTVFAFMLTLVLFSQCEKTEPIALVTVPDDKFLSFLIRLDYSRAEANPPHPFIKVEEAACEGVVFYVEQAATMPMP